MKKALIFIIITFLFGTSFSKADGLSRLTLTEAEMQKLKKYFPEEESQQLVWNGSPITIQLPMGKEKRIVFKSQVIPDLKGSLTTEQLRLVNNDKSLYLTAFQSFPKTRLYVTLKENGKVILIDLLPSENASNATQYIEVKKDPSPGNQTQAVNTVFFEGSEDQLNSASVYSPDYVDLVRFAWRQIYAPERLLKEGPHYARAAMHTQTFVPDLVYGDKIIAHPGGSWVAGQYYVTAVFIQNKYPHRVAINLRQDLCGDWLAAALYPRAILSPHGVKRSDSTTLFLISQKSFGETLGVCHGHA